MSLKVFEWHFLGQAIPDMWNIASMQMHVEMQNIQKNF